MEEKWKNIEGCKYSYEVSDRGRVRRGTKILSSSKSGRYEHITLVTKQGKKDYLIHRLVAIAFVPNPNNYKIVNHKDENKRNNSSFNLEWCTTKYNVNYGRGSKIRCTPVKQINKNGECICIWRSISEAAQVNNIKYQGIVRVCQGLRKTSGGYSWEYYQSPKGQKSKNDIDVLPFYR